MRNNPALSVSALFLLCCGMQAQVQSAPVPTGGGAITLGPSAQNYFQPKAHIDLDLLAKLMLVKPGPVLIATDDVIHVSLAEPSTFDATVRVERNGTITLPYIATVGAAGLSVPELEQRIAELLEQDQYVRQPVVKITIDQQPSSTILISGDVVKPGTISIYGGQTLDHAIAAAGGFLPTASSVLTITRAGYDEPISVPIGPDPTHSAYGGLVLLPGDRVLVSRTGTYYVVGAVKTQGPYPLKSSTPTTVAEAIASAGGYGFEAILDSSKIVRTEGDHRVMISVPAGKIIRGKAKDIALLNDDILFVPTSALKAAVKGGGTGLVVSLASTYLYTHP